MASVTLFITLVAAAAVAVAGDVGEAPRLQRAMTLASASGAAGIPRARKAPPAVQSARPGRRGAATQAGGQTSKEGGVFWNVTTGPGRPVAFVPAAARALRRKDRQDARMASGRTPSCAAPPTPPPLDHARPAAPPLAPQPCRRAGRSPRPPRPSPPRARETSRCSSPAVRPLTAPRSAPRPCCHLAVSRGRARTRSSSPARET
jgi:hypothetical protein